MTRVGTCGALSGDVAVVLGADGHPSPLVRTAHRFGYGFGGVVERVTRPGTVIATHWVVAGTRRIPLSEGENLIGRDPTATVWLDVAGISRRHAGCVRRTDADDGPRCAADRARRDTPGDAATTDDVRRTQRDRRSKFTSSPFRTSAVASGKSRRQGEAAALGAERQRAVLRRRQWGAGAR